MDFITLRPLQEVDAAAAFKWTGDNEVVAPLFWDAHPDEESTRIFLRDVATRHPWFMAICDHGVPVGAITLDRGSGRAASRAELGYVLRRSAWGRGIATQAVKLTLARGFNDLSVVRIEAFVDPENSASIRVLEKAGMQREAVLRRYVTHRGRVRDRIVFSNLG